MSRQRFQTLPGLHVPYPYTLIKLEAEINKYTLKKTTLPGYFHPLVLSRSPIRTRWDWTGGWSCSRRRSCCDLLEFLSISPKEKKGHIQQRKHSDPNPWDLRRSLTELTSQIFRVLSSDADTRRLESEDQATSDMPCGNVGRIKSHGGGAGAEQATAPRGPEQLTSLCPEMVFSNLPSYAPQILMSLSAAGKIKKTN